MNSKKAFNLEELIHPTDRQRQFLEVIGNHRFVLHGRMKTLWINRKFPPELEPLAEEFPLVPARA